MGRMGVMGRMGQMGRFGGGQGKAALGAAMSVGEEKYFAGTPHKFKCL